MERRGIIDAVAHVSHDIANLPEGEDDALFLIGFDFGKDVYVPHSCEQRLIAQLVEVWTGEDLGLR
jgi:hypothetical protein